jgi:hypothetical protein
VKRTRGHAALSVPRRLRAPGLLPTWLPLDDQRHQGKERREKGRRTDTPNRKIDKFEACFLGAASGLSAALNDAREVFKSLSISPEDSKSV